MWQKREGRKKIRKRKDEGETSRYNINTKQEGKGEREGEKGGGAIAISPD